MSNCPLHDYLTYHTKPKTDNEWSRKVYQNHLDQEAVKVATETEASHMYLKKPASWLTVEQFILTRPLVEKKHRIRSSDIIKGPKHGSRKEHLC